MEWLAQNSQLVGMMMMPITYAFVGWMTNVVALKMTFYPLKFIGIPPYLGWQGIVPRKSKQLALKSINMITGRLIKLDEFFSKVDPEQMEKEFQPVLDEEISSIANRLVKEISSMTKEQANENTSDLSPSQISHIVEKTKAESAHVVRDIATQIRDNIASVFNFKNFVLKGLTGPNVKRIVDIFQEVGDKEFGFIEKSGLYFGALLGSLQVALWYLFPIWWTLPIQGVIVGYVTNWLALTMIFRPLYEKKFAFIKYHGLFLKRQDEVSKKYCGMFANQLLTPKNLMSEILYRRAAKHVIDSLNKSLHDEFIASGHSLELEKAGSNIESFRSQLINEIIDKLSAKSSRLEKYMGRALNVERTMYDKMSKLPPEEFEPILRSAFQEDEYVLILIGAVLGAIVGLFQGLYMLLA